MADKKIDKALYGPSFLEVALGAVLGLFAGVLVACAYLVTKPVVQVKEMPKEPTRGAVYYIPGADSNAKSRTWTAKEKQFLAGTNIEVVEDELNAWAASTFAGGASKAAGAKPEDSSAATQNILQPGTPNFKLTDGKMQIGFKCVLNWYGLTKEVTVVTTGILEKSGEKYVYAPQTLYFGSCPLHLLPVIAGPLVSTLVEKKKTPDAINSAWAKLTDVTIVGNTLKLTVQ